MMKTSVSQSTEFTGLNDDEIKRITSVIERDFKLRQKEYRRIAELKKVIEQENQRLSYLTCSKEFNNDHCVRCFKPFTKFFNPKEVCPYCKFNVCHNCATYNKEMKIWACKICLKLRELESLTSDWFYQETQKKYKRCGSAKIVRELYKRDKALTDVDEDLGYGTLRKSPSTDSRDSVVSYVVHDKNLQRELNEYVERMNFLIDNLQADLSNRSTSRGDFKDHQQQMISEINRARIALSGPLRRSIKIANLPYEKDLQCLLIQKTEEILRINLQQFQQTIIASNFDQKLAQIIFDYYINKAKAKLPPKPQRQSSIPTARNHFSSVAWEMKSRNDTIRKMNLTRVPALNEEDIEKEEDDDENQNITPTSSSTDEHTRRFIETDPETIKKSTERVDDWKTNFILTESKTESLDNDEPEEYSTWL